MNQRAKLRRLQRGRKPAGTIGRALFDQPQQVYIGNWARLDLR